MDTALAYATTAVHYALLVLGAAVAALAVIAPATKTEADNRALAFVQKLLGYIGAAARFLLPGAVKGTPAEQPPA